MLRLQLGSLSEDYLYTEYEESWTEKDKNDFKTGGRNKDTEVMKNTYISGSTINNKGTSNQEILCRSALPRAAMKALEKIYKCHDAPIHIKIRIVQAMLFPLSLCESAVWTSKKQYIKITDT